MGARAEDCHRLLALCASHHLVQQLLPSLDFQMVQQEPVLFADTIRDNIRFGKPEATEEEIVAAATVANAHQFITDLPDGYNTMVGERGIRLSGGQVRSYCMHCRRIAVGVGVFPLFRYA